MSKEGIEKYSNKIHEVCLAGVLYPKETVIKTISALVNEYADQQTKELQERVEKLEKINDKGYKLCLDKDDVINKLQAKIDELEKDNENYKQALHGIYNLCDGDNSTHEHIWHIANDILH